MSFDAEIVTDPVRMPLKEFMSPLFSTEGRVMVWFRAVSSMISCMNSTGSSYYSNNCGYQGFPLSFGMIGRPRGCICIRTSLVYAYHGLKNRG